MLTAKLIDVRSVAKDLNRCSNLIAVLWSWRKLLYKQVMYVDVSLLADSVTAFIVVSSALSFSWVLYSSASFFLVLWGFFRNGKSVPKLPSMSWWPQFNSAFPLSYTLRRCKRRLLISGFRFRIRLLRSYLHCAWLKERSSMSWSLICIVKGTHSISVHLGL